MPATKYFFVTPLYQTFGGKLTNRLEHVVPLALTTEQALIDQRADCVNVRTAYALRCLKSVSSYEHGEIGEQTLLLGPEQVVAPADRRAQCSLALRGVAWS